MGAAEGGVKDRRSSGQALAGMTLVGVGARMLVSSEVLLQGPVTLFLIPPPSWRLAEKSSQRARSGLYGKIPLILMFQSPVNQGRIMETDKLYRLLGFLIEKQTADGMA